MLGAALALAAAAAALLLTAEAGERPGASVSLPEAKASPAGIGVAAVYTYGEALRLSLLDAEGQAFRADSLRLESQDGGTTLNIRFGTDLNQGLLLHQLPPGRYRLFYQGRALLAAAGEQAEGYTLTRGGKNKHWRFLAKEGLLLLDVEEVEELPADVYDVYVDIGHGGADTGALSAPSYGLVEAEENLRAGQYLAERLEALGLKVLLSRETMEIPGGRAAEQNPYLPGARIDMCYRSQAKYVISNHLNAGGGHGFQLYSSVATDTAFAQAVADQLLAAGWVADDNGFDPLGDGLYKRRSDTYSSDVRDYYFIIRETGGYLLSPWQYRLQNREQDRLACHGAEALLVEYLFLDNYLDADTWIHNWQTLVDAVARGAADYWGLAEE